MPGQTWCDTGLSTSSPSSDTGHKARLMPGVNFVTDATGHGCTVTSSDRVAVNVYERTMLAHIDTGHEASVSKSI